MNQNDLYLKYAEIIKMCQGTALEDTPWLGVRFNGSEFYDHPRFDTLAKNYQFAVAILEDRAVFVGDTLYWKTTGDEYIVNSYNKCTSMPLGYMTWQPPKPKRTFMINGVELPCPTNQISKYDLHALTINSACFWFETQEEKDLVEDTLLNILTEARDKP